MTPAMVAGDLGMAIGAGTDVAIEAAYSSDEEQLGRCSYSHRSLQKNYVTNSIELCLGPGYNILGMPVVAGVLFPFTRIGLPPWLAGACMAASSLSVVCSSLLLQSYKKPLHIQSVSNGKFA